MQGGCLALHDPVHHELGRVQAEPRVLPSFALSLWTKAVSVAETGRLPGQSAVGESSVMRSQSPDYQLTRRNSTSSGDWQCMAREPHGRVPATSLS